MQTFSIEDGRRYTTFSLNYALFKKGKNGTETPKKKKKKICAVYGEGAVTDWLCQKWLVEVSLHYWHFGQILLSCEAVLCIGRYLAAPLSSLPTRNQKWGDSGYTQNTQINKVIGENQECVLFYLRNITDFLANPIYDVRENIIFNTTCFPIISHCLWSACSWFESRLCYITACTMGDLPPHL